MSAPFSFGLPDPGSIEIVLATGGNGVEFVGKGWSRPEAHGCWTIGTESVLSVTGLDASKDYLVTMPVGPFLHPPELVAQNLRITVSGYELYETSLTGDFLVEFTVPSTLITLHEPTEIVLFCASPTSPSTFLTNPDFNQDGRLLGLSIWGLRLTPVQGQQDSSAQVMWPGKLRPLPKVAAVTMVFNESVYLPIWLKHYASQVGIENCYVIDHGSTDGSTDSLPQCNVLRIPRSPYDPAKQSKWNSEFCSSLLTWFDWVIYSDVDEILMADPAVASSLIEYCRHPLPSVVTAIGLNVLHLIDQEAPLNTERPISAQRPYVFGCASMCKPLLISKRVQWSPGSHSSDAPVVFDHLYMFHLRWFDQSQGFKRLQKTRAMEWAQEDQGRHQRVNDAELDAQMRGFGNYPRFEGIDFNPEHEPVRGYLKTILDSTIGREGDLYKVNLDIWYDQLWHIPSRFIGTF